MLFVLDVYLLYLYIIKETNNHSSLKKSKIMKNAKVFAGWLNGTWTQIKAFKKENAVAEFQRLNKSETPITAKDIKVAGVINSGQAPVDEQ